MDNVLISLKTNIDNTTKITNDLAKITSNIQSGKGTIGMLLMDKSLAQNFNSSIVNLKEGTAELKNLMDDAKNSFEKINMDDILKSLKNTMDNTSNITNDLSDITNNINSGNGTIGRLLMDKSMAQNLDSTFVNMKESTDRLRILLRKAKKSWLLWGF